MPDFFQVFEIQAGIEIQLSRLYFYSLLKIMKMVLHVASQNSEQNGSMPIEA